MRRARRLTDDVVDLITRGQDEGLFREEIDPSLAANAVFGMLNWMPRWHIERDGGSEARELGDGFATLVLAGLSKPGQRLT
jgi:hypothetical protein